MEKYPFPDKQTAKEEIERDVLYNKLVKNGVDIDAITERAWQTGADAARAFYKEMNGETDFRAIARKKGLVIQREYKDNVIAGRRYFSEYLTNKKIMYLYMDSIKKWAKSNGLSTGDAENLILSHEYFHHLENTELGLTSKQVELPVITLFGHGFGKTGVRALSEVGAHGFARTYYELAHSSTLSKNRQES